MATIQHDLIGLARVSTAGQDAGLQRDALVAAGCGQVFAETVSARNPRRGLAAALGQLRPGDTLVVWKLDRLGRSVKDVLKIADDLHDRGVGLRVLTGTLVGTYSPTGEGKFFFTMMAAFAELERDLIHERTMAGLAAARAHHRIGGRPTVMDPDKLAAARARRAKGESPPRSPRPSGSLGPPSTATWPPPTRPPRRLRPKTPRRHPNSSRRRPRVGPAGRRRTKDASSTEETQRSAAAVVCGRGQLRGPHRPRRGPEQSPK